MALIDDIAEMDEDELEDMMPVPCGVCSEMWDLNDLKECRGCETLTCSDCLNDESACEACAEDVEADEEEDEDYDYEEE